MTEQYINIVADIGGTNIRIGVANAKNQIEQLAIYQCALFEQLDLVLEQYLSTLIIDKPIRMCLAIACPVEQDIVAMTNLPWKFSKTALQKKLNLAQLLVINDYTAIALSIALLNENQIVKIGGGEAVAQKPITICGPGTGLGVANLVPYMGDWLSLGGEGGHVDFAPVNETEVKILRFLQQKYKRVSAEQLLSGLGIEQIYQALANINGVEVEQLSAKEISNRALSGACQLCHDTLAQFCKSLGSFAGNLALTMASFGGVYIAGGIVPRFIEFLQQSDFRRRFEEKGRFEDFNRSIPTYVITESQPGILGACVYLRQFNKEDL